MDRALLETPFATDSLAGGFPGLAAVLSALIQRGSLVFSSSPDDQAVPQLALGRGARLELSGLPEAERRGRLDDALKILDAYLPRESDDPRHWPRYRRMRPHVEQILEAGGAAGLKDPLGMLMGEKFGVFLYLNGEREKALPLFQRALELDASTFGSEHPRVATDLNNAAIALRNAGRSAEAERMAIRAVAILWPHETEEPDRLAISLSLLAGFVASRSMDSEAESLHRLALDVVSRNLPAGHAAVARELRGLAAFLFQHGRANEAAPCIERAVQIRCAADPDDPELAQDLRLQAALLFKIEPTADFVAPLRRALDVQEKHFGRLSSGALGMLGDLAAACDARSLAVDAVGYLIERLERVVEGERTDFGLLLNGARDLSRRTDSRIAPALLRATEVLRERKGFPEGAMRSLLVTTSRVLEAGGDHSTAHRLSQAVKETLLRRHVEDAPGDAAAWNVLGLFLKNERDRFDEAERAYRRAIELDPEFATAIFNLGMLISHVRGSDREAEELMRRAAAMRPGDAVIQTGVGFYILNFLGDTKAAEPLLEKAAVFDPNEVAALINLACLRIEQGRLVDARDLIEHAEAQHDATACGFRVLFLAAMLDRLEGKSAAAHLRRLKQSLATPIHRSAWLPLRLLTLLPTRLQEGEARFFVVLHSVAFQPLAPSWTPADLQDFPAWSEGEEAVIDAL